MENNENSVWKLVNDLSNKKGITEIVINDPTKVFVEREGQFIQLNVNLNKEDVSEFISEVADFNKRECNASHPILDGNLPDGSRINVILEPFTQGAPAITIRRYLKHINSFDKDPTVFGLDEKWVDLLKAMVSARSNLIVSGGTGVGKTTLLNLLLNEISSGERVVTIEDTIELSISIPNLVRLEAAVKTDEEVATLSVRDLLKNTLRMRPDRIIIGETRGGELFDLLQAMNTGHEGSMSSIHSNSPGECLSRMETLFLLAGYDVPFHVVRRQISSAVDFIIQISRDRDGKRVISSIQEITGMESNSILSQTIAKRENGRLEITGVSPKIMEKLHRYGGLNKDFFA